MTDLPASGYISDNNRTEGEAKQFFEDIRDCINQIPGGGLEETLTISSGTVTPKRGILSIDTEGATASDTLDAINQGNLPEGSLILVRAANSSQTVTVNHNAGVNGAILLKSASNQDLEADRFLWLKRSGTTWEEVSQLDTALSAFPKSIFPFTNNTYNLGSNAATWAKVWAEQIGDGTGRLNATADLIDGRAKAYVNFNSAQSGRTGATFNVASVTNNSTGNNTVNFTNYFANNQASIVSAGDSGNRMRADLITAALSSASSQGIFTENASGTDIDAGVTTCVSFGDLA